MTKLTLKISEGNSKLGSIPNISLPPILTCRKDVPCHEKCYALKSWKTWPATELAWRNNLELWGEDPSGFFQQLHGWLLWKRPELFRFHVSGDIPDCEYLIHILDMAYVHKETKFLVFTKRFDLDFTRTPPNLTVVLSMWPGMENPEHLDLPRAWCQDGTETRIPKDAIECPGSCETCSDCWNLPKLGKDVFFNLH